MQTVELPAVSPADRTTALEILFRVWVSQTPGSVEDMQWLRARGLEHEYPADTCFRLAGYPEIGRSETSEQYGFLETLRREAVEQGRFSEDKRWRKNLKGRWVLCEGRARVDEHGRNLEHPRTYFSPNAKGQP